jgi:glycogen(starch) synthase
LRILLVGPASPFLISALVTLGHSVTHDPADPEGYDVVHVFGSSDSVVFAGPLVVTVDSTEAGRHQGFLPDTASRAVHQREAQTCAAATRVIVASDYLAWEVAYLFGVPAERIDTIPAGFDVNAWRPTTRAVAAARLRFAGEGPLVVYVGRMVPEKGVADLLAAAAPLRDRHPGARFVFVGEGPARAEFIAEAHRLRLDRAVSFPGHLNHETLAALFGAADAVVLPSRYAASGTVGVEAAAVGAPLAVASIGALASFVEPGVTGLRFPVGDVDAIVEATSVLLGDPVLGRTLGARARFAAHVRHSWAAVAARTVETYAFAIAEGTLEPRAVPPVAGGNLLAGEPAFASLVSDAALFGDDLVELTALDAMADAAAWTAGVEAARAAVRAEAERAAAARETAGRETAGRVAADALDVVLASAHRA